MQLSAKALLKPFNTALSRTTADDGIDEDEDVPMLIDEEDGEDREDGEGRDVDEEVIEDIEDDNIDELEELSDEERTQTVEDTAAVRSTITKVFLLP